MMQFLGMFRHVRTAHAQGLTKEMFVSLGQSAVSARDVYAQGGLIVMAEGEMRNRNQLTRALKLSYDASMSLITARAYRMWGADYPRRIEGAVVTAVIDRAEDRMIVSADRAGAVGVYYAWRARSVAFASHPGMLLKMGAAGSRIEREGVNELFASGCFFTPGKTAFRDIRSLEGGCVLIADARGMRVKRYYSAIQESLLREREPFTMDLYVQTLPKAECALFLSGGLSMDLAEEIKKKGHAVLYRAEAFQGGGEIESFLERIQEPTESVRLYADAYADKMKEAVTHTGFPGTGIGDCVLFAMMKEAFCLFPTAVCGGRGAFFSESLCDGNLLRFLRKEVKEKIDSEGYLRDRFNDLTDKMRLPLSEAGGEEWAERLLSAYMRAGQFAARMRLLADAAGGEVRTPLSDERFLTHMLANLPSNENTHSSGKKYSEECVCGVLDEAREMADQEDQPVFSVVDPDRIKCEIQSENADVRALSRLIQINSFLYQFDAEISLV